MRLRRAWYQNYCQHADRVVEFEEGLTALVGPNGVGKTNLLNGIVWCLTGVDRNPGLKKDNVNLLAGKSEKAGVGVFFEHKGSECEIYRHLNRSGQYLKVQGGKAIEKDDAVKEALQEILGVDERILLDYVFVPQLGLFSFLSQKEAEVARVFSQLFGTEKAELLYNLLGHPELPPEVAYRPEDELTRELRQKSRQLQDCKDGLAGLAYLPEDYSERDSPEYALLEGAALRERVKNYTDLAWGAHQKAKKELEPVEKEYDLRKSEYRAVLGLLNSRRELKTKALEDQAAWRSFEEAMKLWKELKVDLDEANLTFSKSREPARPEGFLGEEEQAELEVLRTEAVRLRKFLEDWQADGKAVCDRCGTPVELIRERLPEAQERLKELEAPLAEYRRRWLISQTYLRLLHEHERATAACRARLESLQKQLSRQPEPRPPKSTLASVEEFLARQGEYEKGFQVLTQEYEDTRRKFLVAKTREQTTARLLAEKEAELARLPEASDSELQSARKKMDKALLDSLKRSELKGQLGLLETMVSETQKELERVKEGRRKAFRITQARKHLEDVRAVFHRDALPKDTVMGYQEELLEETNGLLSEFGAGFRVVGFSDWRFRVKKLPGGEVHSASRLSVGEQILLALASRVIINSTFANELGLLCLDEPTAGLDGDNLACLGVALGRLRGLSKSRGLQVVLVTHDRDVNLFDRVYRLSPAR